MEEIITGLSRIKWLFVIARNSSFTYKGLAVDVKRVGRELGVRYVLEGSVRKAGDRVRIGAQLIEAETGAHLWAERYDRKLEDIFALQDEITLSVVGAIEPSLRDAEIERVKRKRPESLDAYDFVLRAIPYAYAAIPQEAAKALPLLEQALALEAHYAGAHGLLAFCHEVLFVMAGFRSETVLQLFTMPVLPSPVVATTARHLRSPPLLSACWSMITVQRLRHSSERMPSAHLLPLRSFSALLYWLMQARRSVP